VFQDFRLIARKTVFENVSYLPRILGMDREQQRRLAYETLRRVGLAHRLAAFPQQLSGGEKQRVAIARALINAPEILLADEPTGNLDPDLAREILELFVELNLRGTTILFATHDRALIDRLARRVLTLEHGRLLDDRPAAAEPTLPPAPATLDLAAVLTAEVGATEAGDPPSDEEPGEEVAP
jgi:cell division transport system ATP-binding protein